MRRCARDHVLSLVRACRGGRLNDPTFGRRMRGEGAYAQLIAKPVRRGAPQAWPGADRPVPALRPVRAALPATGASSGCSDGPRRAEPRPPTAGGSLPWPLSKVRSRSAKKRRPFGPFSHGESGLTSARA